MEYFLLLILLQYLVAPPTHKVATCYNIDNARLNITQFETLREIPQLYTPSFWCHCDSSSSMRELDETTWHRSLCGVVICFSLFFFYIEV